MFYNTHTDVPWDLQKYYQQRHQIFSKYDEGIWMTEDSWFGVTPEPVAIKIANHVANGAPPEKSILIDCFAGVGGNAIAFALSRRWEKIYAIEKDPKILACAKHNAEIYGVLDRILWHEGDCHDLLRNQFKNFGHKSVIFASPPWGGPSYRSASVFDLSEMRPYALSTLLHSFQCITEDIVLYLPRTSDIRQLSTCIGDDMKLSVVHYCMHGTSKALCVFFGNFKLTVKTLAKQRESSDSSQNFGFQ